MTPMVVAGRGSPSSPAPAGDGDSTRIWMKGASSNGAYVDVATKTKEEVENLLAKLEKEGLEIDDKIARIIDDGIARIKAEAVWENIHKPLGVWMELPLIVVPGAIGFVMGVQRIQKAFREELSKRGYMLSK
nr:unnamed protein product [Digitaria exilis]